MSKTFVVRINDIEKTIEKAQKYLSSIPNGVQDAMRHAFNRALVSGRTAAVKAVREDYTISAADVRKSFIMRRASKSNLSAELESRGERVPLHHFRYSPMRDTTGANRTQVRVGVRTSGGLKPLGQAFVWKGLVMQRLGGPRLPVQHVHGLAVPVMVGDNNVAHEVENAMVETAQKRLMHEVYRLIEGHGV